MNRIQALFRSSQFLRFLLVGGSGYIINLIIFSLLLSIISPPFSAALAFVVSASYSFCLSRVWTFRSKGESPFLQAPKFLIIVSFSITLNILLLSLFVTVLPEIIAQAISVALVTPFNFFGNKLWSFREKGNS